jgi:hypothetical protein
MEHQLAVLLFKEFDELQRDFRRNHFVDHDVLLKKDRAVARPEKVARTGMALMSPLTMKLAMPVPSFQLSPACGGKGKRTATRISY